MRSVGLRLDELLDPDKELDDEFKESVDNIVNALDCFEHKFTVQHAGYFFS